MGELLGLNQPAYRIKKDGKVDVKKVRNERSGLGFAGDGVHEMELKRDLNMSVAWLAKADFYNPTPELGAVSYEYLQRHLSQLETLGEVDRYFDACIPSSIYEANTSEHWIVFYGNEGLLKSTEEFSYSEKLVELGFLILGRNQGGCPLSLDPITGKLFVILPGYLVGDILQRPHKERSRGWIKVPASRENVVAWAETTWRDLDSFFSEVLDSTRLHHRNGLFRNLADSNLDRLTHYRSLKLDLNMLDEEGRTPLDVACQTGNKEVIALVEKIMRETS